MDLTATRLHRDGAPPGDADALVRAISAALLPVADDHAYLMAEIHVVSVVRDLLLGRGFEAERVSPKGSGAEKAPD